LDGLASVIPNPDLFVAMYVRQEAVLSSQIEGTQSTLEDVLQFEIDENGRELRKDVEEVVNYVRAMNYGLSRLRELPLSLRLIREIHAELLKDVRGAKLTPGEFRRSQNWIGPQNSTLTNAAFVPPPVPEMHQALNDLEKFLHAFFGRQWPCRKVADYVSALSSECAPSPTAFPELLSTRESRRILRPPDGYPQPQ